MSEIAENTVVIEEPIKQDAPEAISTEDVKQAGWSQKEIEAAEKRGLIKSPGKENKDETAEITEGQEAGLVAEEKKEKKSSLPDFKIEDPAKEKVFLDTFGAGTPQRAMYFRMKNERQSRQRAEGELRAEIEKRKELEARIIALEGGKVEQEVDEDGNVIDPDDKPLTAKQLREMVEKQREEQDKKQRADQETQQRVLQAQRDQEEFAREVFPDFDDTIVKAGEVMKDIESLVPEKYKQKKVIRLIQDLQVAAKHADQFQVDDYNAAMIAHEIGQFHPDYGKPPSNTGSAKDPKANGSLMPEKMKRIEENTQRRVSSASIPGGGGKRAVVAEEVTAEMFVRMNHAQREKFRKDHPDYYAKLMRG